MKGKRWTSIQEATANKLSRSMRRAWAKGAVLPKTMCRWMELLATLPVGDIEPIGEQEMRCLMEHVGGRKPTDAEVQRALNPTAKEIRELAKCMRETLPSAPKTLRLWQEDQPKKEVSE
jgi:hypothetical protein